MGAALCVRAFVIAIASMHTDSGESIHVCGYEVAML